MTIPILPDGKINKSRIGLIIRMNLHQKDVIFIVIDGYAHYEIYTPELARLISQSNLVMDTALDTDIKKTDRSELVYKAPDPNFLKPE